MQTFLSYLWPYWGFGCVTLFIFGSVKGYPFPKSMTAVGSFLALAFLWPLFFLEQFLGWWHRGKNKS